MLFNFVSVIRAVTKIPSQVVPRLIIAHFEFLAIGTGRRFKCFTKGRSLIFESSVLTSLLTVAGDLVGTLRLVNAIMATMSY
jgi:hypothetical protein